MQLDLLPCPTCGPSNAFSLLDQSTKSAHLHSSDCAPRSFSLLFIFFYFSVRFSWPLSLLYLFIYLCLSTGSAQQHHYLFRCQKWLHLINLHHLMHVLCTFIVLFRCVFFTDTSCLILCNSYFVSFY